MVGVFLGVLCWWLIGLGVLAAFDREPHPVPGAAAGLLVAVFWPLVCLAIGAAVVVGWTLGTIERGKWRRTGSITIGRDAKVTRGPLANPDNDRGGRA